jgi:hypothetical protein
VAKISIGEISKGVELLYQDDECVDFHIQDYEVNMDNATLAGENSFTSHASEVEDLQRQREDEPEDLFEEKEDETFLQYASDNEERAIHNDEGDDSDDEWLGENQHMFHLSTKQCSCFCYKGILMRRMVFIWFMSYIKYLFSV